MNREDLYLSCFIEYVYGEVLDKPIEWDALAQHFTDKTGLPAGSGLGLLYKGFCVGMTGAEAVFKDTLAALEKTHTQRT